MKTFKLFAHAFVTAAMTPSAFSAQFHDKAYYSHHVDEATARAMACDHTIRTIGALAPGKLTDCKAAHQAVHEAKNPEYVPAKGKAWSSAGGSH